MESYPYGMNGKEKDDEVKGSGNSYDYGMRIYDPRLGRFLSVDPITRSYPELTPYQFGSNSPIVNIDIDGMEGSSTTNPYESYGITTRQTPKPQGYWGTVACPVCEMDVMRNNPNPFNVGTMGKLFWSSSTFMAGASYPGALIYMKPYPVITNNPPIQNVTPNGAVNIAPQGITTANFSFDRGQSTGLTPAQTAALSAALPPQGNQGIAPTGPPVAGPQAVNTVINNEGLPQTTITNQTNQPGVQTVNNTMVTINISTGYANAAAATTAGVNAGQLMNQRFNLVRAQLIAQGVPAGNINLGGINYGVGGLTNGNQVNVNMQNNQQTTPVNINTQQTTIINQTYGQ